MPMQHPPSKFAEVAEKSRAKRAKLNATTATREAKRVKDDDEERAARSTRFPGTSKCKDWDTGAISDPDTPTPHALVENEGKDVTLESHDDMADGEPEELERFRKPH
jgi:hypothetical protein